VINSTELLEWQKHLQLKLPFLVLPLAFASFTFIDKKLVHCLAYIFLGISFITAIHVMGLYLIDFEYYHQLLAKGQSLPTPLHHVSYSILMAYSVVAGVILYLEDGFYPKLRIPTLIVSGLLFLFLHVLAVRSGLVTMYLAFFVIIVMRVWKTRNYLQGLGCLLICVLAPLLAYYFIPSFFQKIGYMVWDFTEMMRSKTANYSDGGRLLSYQLGFDLFRENIFLGTGLGDFKNLCEQWYQNNVPEYSGKLNYPHNQFLFSLASTGIVGFVIYQIGLWYPFVKSKLYENLFSLSLYVIVVTSFLVETQLERSVGICFFLYFASLNLASSGHSE